MDVRIFYNDTEITNEVIAYSWQKDVCSGVGVARVDLKRTASVTPVLYNTFTIWEEGTKKGTFYIHTIDRSVPGNTLVLNGQDGSLKLQDYFISESYLIDYASNSKSWIERFLAEATVDYQFDGVTSGTLLNNNTSLGMTTAMEAITPLLQQNGWYITFDADNKAHIGKLSVNSESPTATLHDENIISLEQNNNDKMFRNRVVVWGNASTDGWVYADNNRSGTYANEYDTGNDVRTIVIANGNINSASAASSLAAKALNEFDDLSNEIMMDLPGVWSLSIGDYVQIDTSYLTSAGAITTYGVTMEATGLVTHVILNQRCPRLFAFYAPPAVDHVYAGTNGYGVWRKPLVNSNVWEDFSTGLPVGDKVITDLAIQDNTFACTTSLGSLYTRTLGTSWSKFNPGSFTYSGVVYPASSGFCTCCSIDKLTGEVIAPFTVAVSGADYSYNASWIYYISGGNRNIIPFKDEEDVDGYKITSLDNNSSTTLVSAVEQYNGPVVLWNDAPGTTNIYTGALNESNPLASGTIVYTGVDLMGNIAGGSTSEGRESYAVIGDGKMLWRAEQTQWYHTTSNGYSRLSRLGIKGISTVVNPEVGTEEVNNSVGLSLDETYMYADSIQAVGEKQIAVLVHNQYPWPGNDYVLIMGTKETSSNPPGIDKRINLPREIGIYSYLGTYFQIVNGQRLFYIVYQTSDYVMSLYSLDIDFGTFRLVTSLAIPSTYYEGTFSSNNIQFRKGIRVGNHVCFLGYVWYNDVVLGGYTDTIYQATVAYFFDLTGLHSFCHTAMSDSIIDSADYHDQYVLDYCATDEYIYVHLWGTGDYIFKIHPYLMTSQISMINAADVTTLISNHTHAYGLVQGGVTGYIVQDLDTKAVFYPPEILTSTWNKVRAIPQVSDDSPTAFVYDSVKEKVYAIPLTVSGVSTIYSDITYPKTYPMYGNGADLSMNFYNTQGALVYDSLVLANISSVYSTYYGTTVYSEKEYVFLPTKSGIVYYPEFQTISGYDSSIPRATGDVLFTRFIPRQTKVLNGYKASPYITVLDTSGQELKVESSVTTPYAVFGGTTYSGITISGMEIVPPPSGVGSTTPTVISGIHTGYNQGQLFVSNTGNRGTYTSVLLNGLHSYIPDLRTFEALYNSVTSGVVTSGNYSTFILYPQPTSFDLTATDTEMVILNVSSIAENGGIIISSGTLGQGQILATFSGYANCVETTNTLDIPYMFASVKSPVKFYQKDTSLATDTPTEFVDVTGNLPGEVTVIRCDDRI